MVRKGSLSTSAVRMGGVRDLACYRYIFFRKKTPLSRLSDSSYEYDHWNEFAHLLGMACQRSGCSMEGKNREGFKKPSNSFDVSSRIIQNGWKEFSGSLRQLDSRSFLDVYFLTIAQAWPGKAQPGLINEINEFLRWGEEIKTKTGFLGQACCLCAEVGDSCSKDLLKDVIQDLGKWLWPGNQISELLPLPQGAMVRLAVEDREAALFVYRKVSGAGNAEHLVYWMLPQLYLNVLKGQWIRSDFERCLPNAQGIEKRLDGKLKEVGREHLKLEAIERLNYEISRLQAEYVEEISKLEEMSHNLQLYLTNLGKIFLDKSWGDMADQGRRLFSGGIELLKQQMDSDLCYLRITRHQADMVLSSLTTTASMKGAQWNRRITIILGIFTVIQVAQVLAEFTWPKLIIMLACAFFFLLWYFGLGRR